MAERGQGECPPAHATRARNQMGQSARDPQMRWCVWPLRGRPTQNKNGGAAEPSRREKDKRTRFARLTRGSWSGGRARRDGDLAPHGLLLQTRDDEGFNRSNGRWASLKIRATTRGVGGGTSALSTQGEAHARPRIDSIDRPSFLSLFSIFTWACALYKQTKWGLSIESIDRLIASKGRRARVCSVSLV